jgi:peptidoglycan/LPS O-acetylase OafA/YrhL
MFNPTAGRRFFMRITYGVLGAVLLLFALVQYNDPDFMFWGPIYAVPALWAGIAAFSPPAFRGTLVTALFSLSLFGALAGVYYFWPQGDGWWRQEIWWENEEAREGMGMMIIAVALLILAAGRLRRAP